MCNIRCGSYRQKCVGLGYSAPAGGYMQFFVSEFPLFPRSLGLGHLKLLTITIGFLAPLVIGNANACIRVLSAPRAWPPKYRSIISEVEGATGFVRTQEQRRVNGFSAGQVRTSAICMFHSMLSDGYSNTLANMAVQYCSRVMQLFAESSLLACMLTPVFSFVFMVLVFLQAFSHTHTHTFMLHLHTVVVVLLL